MSRRSRTSQAYSLQIEGYENLAIAAPTDSAMGNVVDRVRLIKGRLADPAAPDEVTIGERLAAQTHLGVGSHLDAQSFNQAQIDKAFSGADPGGPAGPRVRLRVVGIVRRPLDLGVREQSGGVALLTPGFGDKYEGRIGRFTDVLRVKTDAGTARCASCHRDRTEALGRRADVPGAAARHRDGRRQQRDRRAHRGAVDLRGRDRPGRVRSRSGSCSPVTSHAPRSINRRSGVSE